MSRLLARRQLLALAGSAGAGLVLSGCGQTTARAGLYVAGPDGAPRWIDGTTGAPAWSPNGGTLAWGDERGLRIWRTATDELAYLSHTRVVGRPAWSPDNSSVAFLDEQTRLLQAVDIVTMVPTPLAVLYSGADGAIRPPVVTRGGPAWSPDGSQIAFICWDGQGDELCLVESSGNVRQQVTTLGGAGAAPGATARSSVTAIAWSPDSTALAVAVQAEQRGATAGVFRIELAGRSGRRLTNMTANSPLVWDALADDLIFSASVEGRSDVYRLPATGGKALNITATLAEGARDPASDAAGALAVVSGSHIVVLPAGAGETVVHAETQLACSAPALSPNGTYLAYLALAEPIEQYP